MGYNTSMIVLNDALGDIAKDSKFGGKVSDAARRIISRNDYPHGIDIASGSHVNCATVIETHHADNTTLVAFGGNCATVLTGLYGSKHNDPEFQFVLLREAARNLGYKLVKSKD